MTDAFWNPLQLAVLEQKCLFNLQALSYFSNWKISWLRSQDCSASFSQKKIPVTLIVNKDKGVQKTAANSVASWIIMSVCCLCVCRLFVRLRTIHTHTHTHTHTQTLTPSQHTGGMLFKCKSLCGSCVTKMHWMNHTIRWATFGDLDEQQPTRVQALLLGQLKSVTFPKTQNCDEAEVTKICQF